MSEAIVPLRHTDVTPGANPTGEQLLDRKTAPARVWVPSGKVLVLGNSQEPDLELNSAAVLSDGVPVFKRMSGGGGVLLSPGCVCLGLRFAKRKELGIHDYFAQGLEPLQTWAKRGLGLELHLRGTSDLACTARIRGNTQVTERKVAGCSLYMPRDFVLFLVSLLIEPDMDDIEKYLAHPSKEPGYRDKRSHRDFLAGLSEAAGRSLRPQEAAAGIEAEIATWPRTKLDWAEVEA